MDVLDLLQPQRTYRLCELADWFCIPAEPLLEGIAAGEIERSLGYGPQHTALLEEDVHEFSIRHRLTGELTPEGRRVLAKADTGVGQTIRATPESSAAS